MPARKPGWVVGLGMVCITVLTLAAEWHANDPLIPLKMFSVSTISGLAGWRVGTTRRRARRRRSYPSAVLD